MMVTSALWTLLLTPPLHAERVGVFLGHGYQNDLDSLDNPGGALRVSGGWRMEDAPLSLGAEVFLHSPWAPQASNFVQTLVQIAHQGDADFQQPFSVDRFGVHALADLAPIPDAFEEGLSCVPHLFGGLGMISRAEYYAVYDSNFDTGASQSPAQVSEASTSLVVRPLLGIGIETWYAGYVGMRLAVQVRPWIESAPDYDPNDDDQLGSRVVLAPSLAFDLLGGF